MEKFTKITLDPAACAARLAEGRRQANYVIEEMARKGMHVQLFGSMKRSQTRISISW